MMTSRLPLIALLAFSLATLPAIAQKKSGASSSAGKGTKVQKYRDWNVRCQAGAKSSKKQCEMTQLVNEKKTKKPIMRVVIGYPPQGDKPVAVFLLPLGMLLPQGVKLSVNGNSPQTFPIQVCVKQGCRADLQLKKGLLHKLRAGSQATITIRDPRGKQDQLKVSLMGFSAALKHISP